jgi:hypothetical protein
MTKNEHNAVSDMVGAAELATVAGGAAYIDGDVPYCGTPPRPGWPWLVGPLNVVAVNPQPLPPGGMAWYPG